MFGISLSVNNPPGKLILTICDRKMCSFNNDRCNSNDDKTSESMRDSLM